MAGAERSISRKTNGYNRMEGGAEAYTILATRPDAGRNKFLRRSSPPFYTTSILTAHTLYSGILATGSNAAIVRTLALASGK